LIEAILSCCAISDPEDLSGINPKKFASTEAGAARAIRARLLLEESYQIADALPSGRRPLIHRVIGRTENGGEQN